MKNRGSVRAVSGGGEEKQKVVIQLESVINSREKSSSKNKWRYESEDRKV